MVVERNGEQKKEKLQKSVKQNAKLTNVRAIKEWMEKTGNTKPPTSASKNEEEKRLGRALANIRHSLIKPYMRLETEEEREEFRNKHPEIDEVMRIVREIDENNISPYLVNARAIKSWIEKSGNTKLPTTASENEEEKKLATQLSSIRYCLIKPYMLLKTEEERKEFRNKHPEIDEVMRIVKEIDENNIQNSPYLINARAIKSWIEKSGNTKLPSTASENEEEKRLGGALSRIRCSLITPYILLETEEEREKYRENYPEIDEVMKIVKEIDENNIQNSPYLINARAIKSWIEKSGNTKPPLYKSEDEEEKRLGGALSRIRYSLINPYLSLKTEEERKGFRKIYPEIDEVMKVVGEIDENYIPDSPYLINARAIKNWVEKTGNIKLPSASSKNEEEKKLGEALSRTRQFLIKPYMRLETDEEREKFRNIYHGIDEVLDIISGLDMQCGNEKQRELATLIREDIEKRRKLQEAKRLEQEYEKQLSMKRENSSKDNQEQGVDFNG